MARLAWGRRKTAAAVLACAVLADALVSFWQLNQNSLSIVWAIKVTAVDDDPNMENQSTFKFSINFFVDLGQVPQFLANSVLLEFEKERS